MLSIANCDGRRLNFVLGQGANVDIEIVDSSGAAVSGSGIPPDNLYLPGRGSFAALETAPVSNGAQPIDQLGAVVLRIDGTTSTLDCTGPGVAADPAVSGAQVTVVPGETMTVVCHEVG